MGFAVSTIESGLTDVDSGRGGEVIHKPSLTDTVVATIAAGDQPYGVAFDGTPAGAAIVVIVGSSRLGPYTSDQ